MANIFVVRDNKEIFSTQGRGSLNFPAGTLLDHVAVDDSGNVTVRLRQPNVESSSLMYAERMLAEKVSRIFAIKSVRERLGLGLKDAKDLVDREVPVPTRPVETLVSKWSRNVDRDDAIDF